MIKKKLIVTLLFIFISLGFLASPIQADDVCTPNWQSCDVNKPCCDFPTFYCHNGYCKTANEHGASCGGYLQGCCSVPPNTYPCIQGYGLQCIEGYCKRPPTPTLPSCGYVGQLCCAGNVCLEGICAGGYCRPGGGSPPPSGTTTNITPWNPEQAFCDLGGGKKGINTALGCINVEDSQGFVAWFFQRFVGIAGGIALVLMIWGSIKVILSGGDPEKVKDGKSLVTSAASGLLFMIFSLLLLRFIGVDVLELPGLTK